MDEPSPDTEIGPVVYQNALASESDVSDFRLEGQATVSFPNGRLRLENVLDPAEGQRANFVYWCPRDFDSDISVTWDFWPVREPGLCMLFFAARGRRGEDIFDPGLAERTGEYRQYHHGDFDAYHVSYFRRNPGEERAFHTCNLRKSYGFHLVAMGADPIPDVDDATPPYHMKLVKSGSTTRFSINELSVLHYKDNDSPLGPGKIGFRQMAPLIGEYSDLVVRQVT